MRLLFALDRHDHDDCERTFVRNSARAVICEGNRLLTVHSRKFDYYKFPGGGIEAGESPVDALIRETREEAGRLVLRDTVREYGCVHRVHRSEYDPAERFVQDNYYYLCAVSDHAVPTDPDLYEREEGFEPVFIEAEKAIRQNRRTAETGCEAIMLEREARVMEMLLEEGYLG